MIPEASHLGGFQARPRAYENRVTRFFDRASSDPETEPMASPTIAVIDLTVSTRAGRHSVRPNERVFGGSAAWHEGGGRCDLYHSSRRPVALR